MNNQGWIKLHRKILDNPTLQNANCFIIFTKLLLSVDRTTGQIKMGRKQLSDLCGIKQNTCYRASKRLVASGMVQASSNRFFTTYSICNWGDYQHDGNNPRPSNVRVTSVDGNTLTRRKNKEERNTTTLYAPPEDPMPDLDFDDEGLTSNDAKKDQQKQAHPDVQKVISKFENTYGLKLKQIRTQRAMAFNLVKRYTLPKTLQAIDVSHRVLTERYAPQITDLRDLWEKWDKLAAFLIKQRATQQGKVAIIREDEE